MTAKQRRRAQKKINRALKGQHRNYASMRGPGPGIDGYPEPYGWWERGGRGPENKS